MNERGVCKEAYGVGRLPGRSSVALYRTCDASTRAVAYFKDEADARSFMEFVDTLVWPVYHQPVPDPQWHGWAKVAR